MGSLKMLMDGTQRLGTWADPRCKLARGIAQCFKYLHHGLNDPLIHRDLKPDNVLVTNYIGAKLADFGTSRAMDSYVELQCKRARPHTHAGIIHVLEPYPLRKLPPCVCR